MMECVVNVSEGRDGALLAFLGQEAGTCLLDVHRDTDHHRSVFTLGGEDAEVQEGARRLAAAVVAHVDITRHCGAHPRMGALDVVPFVALDTSAGVFAGPVPGGRFADGSIGRAIEARDRFADWAAEELHLPCFLYGPERSLPEVRRQARGLLPPDREPARAHRGAGATAVGARQILIAYNLWLHEPDLAAAVHIASQLRSRDLRTLGLAVGSDVQVSCNLVAPFSLGPAAVFDAVAARADIDRAELVGLAPRAVLDSTPRSRWAEVDLSLDATLESRLDRRPVAFLP